MGTKGGSYERSGGGTSKSSLHEVLEVVLGGFLGDFKEEA